MLTKEERDIIGEMVADMVKPHPDGKPWDTCCGSKGVDGCQCFMRKPRNCPSRFERMRETGIVQSAIAAGARFFCVHQKDGKFHRECAGWARKIRKVK